MTHLSERRRTVDQWFAEAAEHGPNGRLVADRISEKRPQRHRRATGVSPHGQTGEGFVYASNEVLTWNAPPAFAVQDPTDSGDSTIRVHIEEPHERRQQRLENRRALV